MFIHVYDDEGRCLKEPSPLTNPALVSRIQKSIKWKRSGHFKLEGKKIAGYSDPNKRCSLPRRKAATLCMRTVTHFNKTFNISKGSSLPHWENDDVRYKTFVENAFYLRKNRDRIFSDSRMLLAPVMRGGGGPIDIGAPTLGTFLMWWEEFEGNTEDKVIVSFGGSWASGAHGCTTVNSKGEIGMETEGPYKPIYLSFAVINGRIAEATYKFEGYSICDVVDILKREDYEREQIEEWEREQEEERLEALKPW